MELLEKSGPSELAPYGLSTPLPPSYTAEFSPFKPVTHGQARFTKFAIVDRFDQVISGIRLSPNGEGALYSSISPVQTGWSPSPYAVKISLNSSEPPFVKEFHGGPVAPRCDMADMRLSAARRG